MSLSSVILLINNNIIPNNNNEITADVLRPILIEMLQQPNDLIGVLGNLQTDDKSNLVNAINEVVNDIGAMSSVKVLSGDVDPNTIVQQDANPGDLYSQTDALGNPIKIWLYDGNLWQSIDVGNAVLFTPQPLTATQQQIARDNVEVYSKDEVNALLQPLSYTESYYEHLLTPADLVNRIMSFDLAHEPKGAFDFLYIGSAPVSPASYRVVGTTLEIDQDTFDYELQSGRKILYRYTY